MTTLKNQISHCPTEYLLNLLAGKWKVCIFRYSTFGAVRFGQLLKILPGSNRQSLTNALRELEEAGILERKIINLKPLHIEYTLTEAGEGFIPVFKMLESLKLIPGQLTKTTLAQ